MSFSGYAQANMSTAYFSIDITATIELLSKQIQPVLQ
jgi:hypothetical protein